MFSSGNKVSVVFTEFDLQESDSCNEEYIEVREGGAGGQLLNLACSSDAPNNLTQYTSIWIKFKSGELSSKTGFKAYYSLRKNLYRFFCPLFFFLLVNICLTILYCLEHGSDLFGSSGQIASPLYPLHYNQLGVYDWRIEVDRRKVIKIIFKEISINSFYLNGECLKVGLALDNLTNSFKGAKFSRNF